MIENFDIEMSVEYRGETYKVRDNGSVFRHSKGTKNRRYDNTWMFGNKSKHHPYLTVADHRVHQIIATAFHGQVPGKNYVVDHIDTNCRNNRPENLRWVTRLENALLNPITRKKIEHACGSIEKFKSDPSILQKAKLNKNFEWMRNVTKEEAEASIKRLQKWSKEKSSAKFNHSTKRALGEWIFSPLETDLKFDYVKSLTRGCIQFKWWVPTSFPCCPAKVKEDPLYEYFDNIMIGEVFCFNEKYPESYAVKKIKLGTSIYVLSHRKGIKPWGIIEIRFEDGYFVHISSQSCFTRDGIDKAFTLLQGHKWEGPDSIDDFC